MNILSWKNLQDNGLQSFLNGSLSWFIFHSKGVESEELKKLILTGFSIKENLPLDALKLTKTLNGKPEVQGTNWKFNLSHSGDYTAVVFHPSHDVGIDLETWKPRSRLGPIVERYFFEEEKKLLGLISEDSEWESQALRMFTSKEALIKLKSGTLFRGLSEINTANSYTEIKESQEVRGALSLTVCSST